MPGPIQIDSQTSFARGMRDSAAPTEYAQDEVETLLNGRPSRVGNSIEPRGGSQRTHAAEINSGAEGVGAIEYATAGRDQRFVVAVGDTWYQSADQGETWTAIGGADGLAATPWSMVLMRVGAENRVIGANGGSVPPVSWSGSGDVVSLDEWPGGIRHLAVLNDRLFGSDGTITVRGSNVGEPNVLATADGGLSIQCQAHDDDPQITGLWTHGVVLLVFKRRSMGYIEGFGYNSIRVQTGDRGMSRSVGCIAHRTLAPAGDGGVCWLSDRGLEYMGPGGVSPQLVSQPIQGFMDTLDYAGIASNPGLPCALWWQRREEYWLAVPSGSATQNTHIIVFRPPSAAGRPPAVWLFQAAVATGGTFLIDDEGILQVSEGSSGNRVRIINGILELDSLTGSFVEVDANGILELTGVDSGAGALFVGDRGASHERPHLVGYDGFVRELEVGDMDDVLEDGTGGEPIQAKVRSRPFIYGDPLRNKRPISVRLSALPEMPTQDVSVRLFGDGEQLQQRDVRIVRGSATRPRATRARMGGRRASAIQIEVAFQGRVTLQAMEAAVRLLDEVP